jgi:hypothetical protein
MTLSQFTTETDSFRVMHKIIHKQLKHKIICTFSGCPPPKKQSYWLPRSLSW